jgi:hypothetical protein
MAGSMVGIYLANHVPFASVVGPADLCQGVRPSSSMRRRPSPAYRCNFPGCAGKQEVLPQPRSTCNTGALPDRYNLPRGLVPRGLDVQAYE